MVTGVASTVAILTAVMAKVHEIYRDAFDFKLFTDNVFGRCCGSGRPRGDSQGGRCNGYVGGKPAPEHYQDGLFGTPTVTTWTRGQPAEVYWASAARHKGGYAYRLCKVNEGKFWEVTEECFQQGHLNFHGTLTLLLLFF